MGLEQTRPYEEDTFVDNGTISNDELWFLIDNDTFTEPQKIARSSIGGGGSSSNVQKDILTGLASRSVSVAFSTAFTTTPVGWIKVYRMQANGDGTYSEYEVIWGYASSTKVSLTGFSIVIHNDESLTGIVVEYRFE